MSYYDARTKRTKGVYASSFLLLVIIIAVIGYISYRNFEQQFRAQAERQISAIAELKVNELEDWRKERLNDAEFLYHNPSFSSLIERYLETPDDLKTRSQLLTWLEQYQVYDQYDMVLLLDVTGADMLSIITPGSLDSHLTQDVVACLRSGEITFLDFHRNTSSSRDIDLAILVPIFTENGDNRPLGVLVLDINPYTYLYPYIQQWPAASQSAETLLVRRDGEGVLFLNELRFEQNAALTLRFPLTDIDLPAVKAVLGQSGIVEGVDYRGKSVLADVRAVPNSPWFLVSKMDTAEVYGPLRTRLWQTLVIIGMAIFVAGAGVALVWREQRILFYRSQAEAAEALRNSEEKFRKAFVLSPDSVNINRLQDGMYVSINNGFTKIMGYTPDEVIGKTSLELNIWADPQERKTLVDGLLKNGEVANLEACFLSKNGDTKYGLMSASVLELNHVPHIISITRDITERKQAEAALRESEEKYRRLFDNAPLGIFQSTMDGKIISINRVFANMLGYDSPEDAIKNIKNVATDIFADPNRRAEIIHLIAQNPDLRSFENVYRRKDGSTFIGNLNAIPIRDPGGHLVRTEGIVEDITARKQAEEALRQSEEHYRTVVSNTPVVTFVTDEKGIFTLSEGKGLIKLGLQAGQVVGLSVFDLYRDYPTIMDAMKKALDGYSQRGEVEVQGTVFDVFYSPVFDQQGKVVKVIGVSNDITERKHTEKEIRKLNAELEERVRERTAQLETTNKELEAFSYSVSHDLRAPLRGIDGWSQALLEDYHDQLDEQGRQYIERVRSETQRMGHLIDDMLQLSRLTRTELIKEQVDLSALAQAVANRLKHDDPHRQVDFNIQIGLTARGDPRLLESVLINLLGNAFKFTCKRTDARIEFAQTESQGQLVFFVRDNGAGFDMAYSQKLFGAFQRMHKLSEFPGTGVGLAIVQRIIHRHAGRVWAEAEVERGATFYFTLEDKT